MEYAPDDRRITRASHTIHKFTHFGYHFPFLFFGFVASKVMSHKEVARPDFRDNYAPR